jgi:lysophospholipase L1-like esterase
MRVETTGRLSGLLPNPGARRLGTAAMIAAIVGLSSGWAIDRFASDRLPKRHAGKQILSQADLIKTDIWKTFGTKGTIVMVGDSHTEYADWQAMFPGVTIVNRGIGGDTTLSVLARLDTILSVSATTAFVTIGTNDILRGDPLDQVKARYHTILDRLIDHGARVVVTSTPLTTSRRTNVQITDLNADIETYCGRKSCAFVDLNTAISHDGLLSWGMTLDGVHLNGAGYLQWAAMLAPHVRREVDASR